MKLKRKIDAYFFDIEDDEYVAISDQLFYYGGIACMFVMVFAVCIAVY